MPPEVKMVLACFSAPSEFLKFTEVASDMTKQVSRIMYLALEFIFLNFNELFFLVNCVTITLELSRGVKLDL